MNQKNKSKTLLMAGLGVAVLGGGAWGLTKAFSKPRPTEAQEFAARAKEDPVKVFDEMREKMRDEKTTEEEREKLRKSMREAFESRMNEAVAEYYNAKPEDREAVLNKHIDEFEKFRKMREERQEEEKAKAEGKTDEEREKEREKERERWRKSMNDRTKEERKSDSETSNPNDRARRMAYRAAMFKQMQARGIQPPRWGGPGGGGRGGHGPGRG